MVLDREVRLDASMTRIRGGTQVLEVFPALAPALSQMALLMTRWVFEDVTCI